MKKIFVIIFMAFTAGNIFAQTEKEINKTISGKFETYYNQDKYDEIFNMFAKVMKDALPNDKTKEFLTQLKSQAGKIVSLDFENYLASYASYKAKFEKAVFTLNISVDNEGKINGLFIKPYQPDNLPKIERNTSKLMLAFNGEWAIFWGGDTKELNYHVESKAQKNALDFIMKDSTGKSYKTDGKTNEDYLAFGQYILSPCEGDVVLVVDGVKDNIPGELNPIYMPGNTVIVKTDNNEYLFFAHFKKRSIKVREGQRVRQGALLGLCGNSGNSSEPHLHFHIQNVEDMNIATGVKCFFEKIMVNGKIIEDYSPIKNDKIQNNK
jgi:hypothetical protein